MHGRRDWMELDERKEKILKAIIQNYLETGEPVGSRTISKYSDLKLSSATIRNEMSDLEELGYIIQPHTSAGRIPSDKGYRFYVDQLIHEKETEVTQVRDMVIQRVDRVELLLKQMAKTISRNYKDIHLLVLLIDERPEEVTDIRESIEGPNVEVIYSTFDELPEHHKRVSEMVLERAKRLVEHKRDVVILLDSITRLARAYNLIVPPSGRTLTGGLDPAALHMPKKFFGAARNIREGGSLTILATALVETGSKMDDVVFEEFKGTGNMELVLDRKLSEKRIFPAIDITKSGTRREDLLLSKEEQDAMYLIRREIGGSKGEEAIEEVLKLFVRTKNNQEFLDLVQKSLGRR